MHTGTENLLVPPVVKHQGISAFFCFIKKLPCPSPSSETPFED